MAKYSVGGTEIINNSGQIDWSKLTGTPSAATVSGVNVGTITNCGADLAVNLTRSTNSGGTVTFTLTAVIPASASNCNCNCTNSFNCG